MGRQNRVEQTPDPEPTPQVDGQIALDGTDTTSSGGNPTDVEPAPDLEAEAVTPLGEVVDLGDQDDFANEGRAYDALGNVRPADARMGEVWEIQSDSDVIVERPDGVRVRIASDGQRVQHVLDVPGEYVADTGDSVTAG
jgi:hypothetical protein